MFLQYLCRCYVILAEVFPRRKQTLYRQGPLRNYRRCPIIGAASTNRFMQLKPFQMRYSRSFFHGLSVRVMLASLLVVLATGCIRDEAASSECDIYGVSEEWLSSLPSGFLLGSPVVKNRSVAFMVSADADVSALAPKFLISPGATIFYVQEDGTVVPYDATQLIDFSMPQTFRVVSEDEAWSKDYLVSFDPPRPLDICDFEDFGYNDAETYQRLFWKQTDGSVATNLWDSGNAGFAFTGQAKTPLDYPTTFIADETSYDGRYACLRTLSTGSFGSMVGMPIAAGNLFLGEFQVMNAVANPLQATRFGLQIVKAEPESIECVYRYTPGANMVGGEAGEIDACDIYAVLFKVDPNAVEPLFGDNVKTDERIVAIAELQDGTAKEAWTAVRIPFVMREGQQFDEEQFRMGGYALTIVMTSSREGAYFHGAPGSTLCVDNLKINWKTE